MADYVFLYSATNDSTFEHYVFNTFACLYKYDTEFMMALALAVLVGLLIWIFYFSWKIPPKYFPSITIRFDGFWDE